jgi:uncharacterized protein YdeI (YjbR/CyaY-like superfamily)
MPGHLILLSPIPHSSGMPDDYPTLLFETKGDFAKWLEQHHAAERGVWLRLAKAAAELQSINHAEALDVALCYGWIDGQAKSYDSDSWVQKFTPRGKRSVWSKRNQENVQRLIASGDMRPAGLAAIETAKADGRWQRAYDSPSNATVPEDFQAELDRNRKAKRFFETLKANNRYAILHRIQTAVKPETRARRIAQFIAMLERNETIY